jgi:hypothetical protein
MRAETTWTEVLTPRGKRVHAPDTVVDVEGGCLFVKGNPSGRIRAVYAPGEWYEVRGVSAP